MHIITATAQFFADRILIHLLKWAAIAALKTIVYLPQLLSGYFIGQFFLSNEDPLPKRVIIILVTAAAFYILTILVKKLIIALKEQRHWGWLPLLIAALTYTCIIPVFLLYPYITDLVRNITHRHTVTLSLAISALLGFYCYFRYDFLELSE